ncbi:MAG: iron-sulfur cluster assembly scaffold protein [Dehalococcoidia bacterium]
MTAESLSGYYSETLVDHFEHPRNAGAMEGADAEGFVTNPVCGDSMRLFLRIDGRGDGDAETRIAAASFLTSGCPASIATSSVATELLTGLTLSEAEALTRDDFAEAVGGLPKPKLHCSVLAQAAVRNAITAWRAGDADSR